MRVFERLRAIFLRPRLERAKAEAAARYQEARAKVADAQRRGNTQDIGAAYVEVARWNKELFRLEDACRRVGC